MVFDSWFYQSFTAKIDEDTYQVQVVSWYDNENSYTSQMVRTIKYFAELASLHHCIIAAALFTGAAVFCVI